MSDNAMANKAAGNETDRPPETTTLSDDELRASSAASKTPPFFRAHRRALIGAAVTTTRTATTATTTATSNHRSRPGDWTRRETVRANRRRLVKRVLRKRGYPPDKREPATRTVLEEGEAVSEGWTA